MALTNLQYLTINCGGTGVSADELSLYLQNAGLNANANADTEACDMVLYKEFSIILRQALMNVSEGGMSVSWNMEAVKAYYATLCDKTGQPNVLFSRPVIRDRSNLW